MEAVLKGQAVSIDDKMKFECTAGEEYTLIADYTPPYGTGQGPMPLELFLASLCACLGASLSVLLRPAGKKIDEISVKASGIRRKEHPTSFESIDIFAEIKSSDVTQEDAEKAIMLAEKSICPLAAMIKGNVEVKFDIKVTQE